jgi:hypothetical protein
LPLGLRMPLAISFWERHNVAYLASSKRSFGNHFAIMPA